MKKRTKKQAKSTPEYDSAREQNVLLDKMASNVKTIAEGHSGIVKRLDNIEFEIGSIKTKVSEIDSIKMAVMDNNRRIKENSVKIDRIENKLDTVTTDHEKRLQKLEA